MDYQALLESASKAGYEAVAATQVVPMVVNQCANPMNDSSPVVKSWFVADGPCGFASIIVRPGNSAFARFLVKNGIARKHYAGGVSIYVSQFNQSLQKKESYAYAFSKVLSDAGFTAYVDSRLD